MPTFRDGRSEPIDFSREMRRYDEKLMKALRENLWEFIESTTLIGRGRDDPDQTVILRIKGVKEFTFRFAQPGGQGAGQLSDNGSGDAQGQLLGRDLAGTEPGEKVYDDYEISREALQNMFFERWNLPPPEERGDGPLTYEKKARLSGLRKKGAPDFLARRETLRARSKRLFQEFSQNEDVKIEDKLSDAPFAEDDFRYRRFTQEEEGTQAARYGIRDISASMQGVKQEACRLIFTYIWAYLERRFQKCEERHIVHTTEAEETNELDFFRRSSSGGTTMSPALKLMLKLIAAHHSPDEWNIYGMYASDGENDQADNALSVELINQILDVSRLFVYLETLTSAWAQTGSVFHGQIQAGSKLYQELHELSKRRKNLVVVKLADFTPKGVKQALDTIFEREWEVS